MPETVASCPLCNESQSVQFDQRDSRGYQVTNQLCMNCGLVYQSPRMTESELDTFYRHEYRQIYQGSEDPGKIDLTVQQARAKVLVNILKEVGIEKVQRFADIGSSSGLLLERIRDEYQCQIVGIEPGRAYRDYTEKRGLKVYDTLKAAEDAGEPVFDLISLIHVLEHIPDPIRYLKNLREKYLALDGNILIEVPNLYAHDSFEIAHLTSFSRQSLFQTVKKAGYSRISIQLHGLPRSNLIPLYITLLAGKSTELPPQRPVEAERWIRLKRRTGMAHRRVIEQLFPRQAWLADYR